MRPPKSRDDFRIAIICALRNEADAVEAIFDDIYKVKYHKHEGDPNHYVLGRIGEHHVVLVRTPGIGKVNAANAAAGCRSSFTRITLGLVVGICGGVPEPAQGVQIFKGDIIVSTYVIQSDFGRQYHEGVERRTTFQDVFTPHSPSLKSFLETLQSRRVMFEFPERIFEVIAEMGTKKWFNVPDRPDHGRDYAYKSDYHHIHRDGSCEKCLARMNGSEEACLEARKKLCSDLHCEPSGRIERVRSDGKISLFFGNMASSDQVMKSAAHRDAIVNEEEVIGFEMEGAGVWDIFPTLVVKSVSDYADSHKDKEWQDYAAVQAAAAAKVILTKWEAIDSGTIGHLTTSNVATDLASGFQLTEHDQLSKRPTTPSGIHNVKPVRKDST